MLVPKFSTLTHYSPLTLYYNMTTKNIQSFSPKDLAERINLENIERLLSRSLQQSRIDGFCAETLGRYRLTSKGIEHAESFFEKNATISTLLSNDSFDFLKENGVILNTTITGWNTSDELGALPEDITSEIKNNIQECRKIARSSDLTQAEIAQIDGQLKACEEIAETPTPKWGIVKRLLKPLAQVASIADMVRKFLALFI